MNQYLLKNKKVLALYGALAVITYVLLTLVYWGYAIITEAAQSKSLQTAYYITFFSITILLVLLVFIILLSSVKRNLLYLISTELRTDVFEKICRMDYKSYSKENTSYYTSILTNDVETIEDDYFSNAIELIGDSIQLLAMLVSILIVGWQYLLIVLLFSSLSIIQPYLLKGKLANCGLDVSKNKELYTEKVKEFIYSFETIKVFRKEKIIHNKFHKTVIGLEKSRKDEDITKAVNACLLIISVYLIKIGSTLFFIHSSIAAYIGIAIVTTLIGLTNNVGNPIASILDYIKSMNSTLEVRNKVIDFLTGEEERLEGKSLEDEVSIIQLNQINFSFDHNKKILDGLDMCFEKGKKYALLGESGSGKSTVLKLLMRYFDEYSGVITINGINIKEYSLASFRSKIAYINQNVFLFEGTLRENICMLRDGIDDSSIMQAIEKTGLKDVYQRLPEGLNTLVKEGGQNFSGGEKQRIAFARAYLGGADVLLVDEGASALDNITAVEVEKTLLTLDNITVISVIHRMNETVHLYDELLVLEDGKVKHKGTYQEISSEYETNVQIAVSEEVEYEV